MKPGKVRPLAICVFRHGDRILVSEGVDDVKEQTYYRPLGGRIEFGETGAETVRRELMEEISAEVGEVRYMQTLENIFTYNGLPGHEIVLVYDGAFTDPAVYDTPEITAVEHNGTPFRAIWKRLDEFSEKTPLYPDGLMELLTISTGSNVE